MYLYKSLSPEDKITYAKDWIYEHQPFFSYIAMHLQTIDAKEEGIGMEMPTMAVRECGDIIYNPDFINGLDKDEIVMVLSHEIMHVAMEHLSRRIDRDPKKWNYACDFVVNALLKEAGFKVTKAVFDKDGNLIQNGVLYDPKYDGMSAEEVYAMLPEELVDQLEDFMSDDCDGDCSNCEGSNNQQSQGKGSCNKQKLFKDEHLEADPQNEEEKKKLEEKLTEMKDRIIEAAEYARTIGKLPGSMKSYIDGIYKTKIDWRHALRKYIMNTLMHDYTWSKPAKSTFVTGIYLPGIRKEGIEVTVAVDTSGSISDEQLKQFKSEIFAISRSFDNITVHMLMHDTDIQEYQMITESLSKGGTKKFDGTEWAGRGGTDHRPVFDYVREKLPNTRILICLTDAWTNYPEKIPTTHNTLWALIENHGYDKKRIPFGDVIEM